MPNTGSAIWDDDGDRNQQPTRDGGGTRDTTAREATARALRGQAATVRDAKIEIARQMAILWEAKLDMAIATGSDALIREAIDEASSSGFMDNCNCGGGGGGGGKMDREWISTHSTGKKPN
ncbi:hypothetical protein IU459_23215 [Nocardia amamiensis]|uniref:Uncharacterized protein n=1 Tax=Nocardia amamiensis TaxID=404578 RepID=A0ABS0CUY9_9NOCA|nr:hypothetical protein [Nocardia amamiensis]MBF6300432.1 hypothetical protein [Nocardia amamiensis]